MRCRANAFVNAGDYSVGGFVWFKGPGVVTGIIFYTAMAGTIKVSLFNPAGDRVATVDVVCAAAGTYTGTFATPYEITEDMVGSQTGAWNGGFAFQMWETSGTSHTQSMRADFPNMCRSMWFVHYVRNFYRRAGDVWMGTAPEGGGGGVYVPIDIVGYGLGERAVSLSRDIVVVRGADNDGPFRRARESDNVRLNRLAMTPFTVENQPVRDAGSIGYCSDGNAGAPTGCVYDGTIWRKLTLGDEIVGGEEV